MNGITSLNAGAPDLRLTGNQRPQEDNIRIKIKQIAEQSGHPESFPATDSDFAALAQLSDSPDDFPSTDYDFEVILRIAKEPGYSTPEQSKAETYANYMAQGGRIGYKQGYSVQGGGPNYLGEQPTAVDAPINWQSSPDHEPAHLAYITDAEQNLLVNKDMYGSLDGTPNRGPSGIPSLQGDMGSIGGGSDARADSPEDKYRYSVGPVPPAPTVAATAAMEDAYRTPDVIETTNIVIPINKIIKKKMFLSSNRYTNNLRK